MSQEKIENNIIELDAECIIPMPEDGLPQEIISKIFSQLDIDSQNSLALSHSMFGHSVFQNERIKKKLFALAGSAEQGKMEVILRKYPEFLRVYAPLKDISGRVFKNITLFQHAIWTGDVRYMANMMLDCLQNHAEGESIRQELLSQYQELMENELSYELNGQSYQEKQFSLQPLIDALTTYVKNCGEWTYKERFSHWCTQVGLSQTLLPAHIRHHYCETNIVFWKTPSFQKNKFTRSLKFYNNMQSSYQLWDESLVGLGVQFGMDWAGAGCIPQLCGGEEAGFAGAGGGLAAMEALCKVRTEDLQTLIQRLQNPIQNLEKDQKPSCMIL